MNEVDKMAAKLLNSDTIIALFREELDEVERLAVFDANESKWSLSLETALGNLRDRLHENLSRIGKINRQS
jgi:hypothetical protein